MRISYIFSLLLIPFFLHAQNILEGKVISVKDGDTIEILYNGEPLRIRLAEIDCPEKNQDFGQKAKQFTSDLCFWKIVTVISKGKDRYGRTLGKVFLSDGRSLNKELVKEGLAWHYKSFSKDENIASLEEKAKAEKKGLWCQSNCIAPWEYRKIKRNIK